MCHCVLWLRSKSFLCLWQLEKKNWAIECCEGAWQGVSGAAFTQFDRQCTLCSNSKRMVVVLVAQWTMMLIAGGGRVVEMERSRQLSPNLTDNAHCAVIAVSWWEKNPWKVNWGKQGFCSGEKSFCAVWLVDNFDKYPVESDRSGDDEHGAIFLWKPSIKKKDFNETCSLKGNPPFFVWLLWWVDIRLYSPVLPPRAGDELGGKDLSAYVVTTFHHSPKLPPGQGNRIRQSATQSFPSGGFGNDIISSNGNIFNWCIGQAIEGSWRLSCSLKIVKFKKITLTCCLRDEVNKLWWTFGPHVSD